MGGREGLLIQLRKLASHSAVYGAADVFGSVITLLLTPVLTRYLDPVQYGDLQLLALFTAVAKILFRLGLDAGFFRVYYDQAGKEAARLAGSVALFAAGVGAAGLALSWAAAGPLTLALLGDRPQQLVLLAASEVALGTLLYVPLNLLRIQDRPGLFSALQAGRHALNLVLKVLLVMAGHGVAGVLWSDLIATAAIACWLAPVLLRSASLSFDWPLVRAALAFGLPKVPHGFLIQVQNLVDRRILDHFVSRAVVGQYGLAYAFGTAVKFALSAFEPAWGPFIYSRLAQPDAPRTLARVVTWAWLGFVWTGAAVACLGFELLAVFTARPEFREGAPVIPIVVLAYLFHGVFLLTSVGIGIAKRTRWYPAITAASALTNVAANFALIPRLGMRGAAWATVLSYAVMAGFGYRVSQRLYPLPLEWGRLARVSGAGLCVFLLSRLVPGTGLGGAIAVKLVLLLALPALLLASGFASSEEWRWLAERRRRGRTPSTSTSDPPSQEEP